MNGVEIMSYEGEGYNPTMHYDTWRIAFANYSERFDEKLYNKLERHMKTDEVFVLLKGFAALIIGESCEKLCLEPFKIYNVKAGTWHNITMEKDAKVLIVENHDTSKDNTEYLEIK